MTGLEKKERARPAVPEAFARNSKACTVCRQLKMKCVQSGDDAPCKRCRRKGVECTFAVSRRGRPKSRPPDPLASSESTTATLHPFITPSRPAIEDPPARLSLTLEPPISPQSIPTTQHYSLGGPNLTFDIRIPLTLPQRPLRPDASTVIESESEYRNPLGLLAEAAQSSVVIADPQPSTSSTSHLSNESLASFQDVGIANRSYFQRSTVEPSVPYEEFIASTEIMSILTPEDVEDLFQIYLDHLHVHSPTVDRDHCTPELVASRSTYLFNAICCVAGRYYKKKPTLGPQLRDFAKKTFAKFPKEKSLEAVQAEILYCGYGLVPAKNHIEDMCWTRVGLALRMALDLHLHQAGTLQYEQRYGPQPQWRTTSMKRTWLICLTVDKMLSCQMGKPTTLYMTPATLSDTNAFDSADDRRVCANVELSNILAEMLHSRPCGGQEPITEVDQLLEQWREKWMVSENWGNLSDEQSWIRQARLKLYFTYAQLLVASITLETALPSDPSFAAFAHAKYQMCALAMLNMFREELGGASWVRYCTDFHFTYVLFGAISLLKSLQPQFKHSIINPQSARKLITAVADLLQGAAASWDHLPALQATFLRRVLRARMPELEPVHRDESVGSASTFQQEKTAAFDESGTQATESQPQREGEAYEFEELAFAQDTWNTFY